MRKPTNYCLVSGSDMHKFVDDVTGRLQEGYEPLGPTTYQTLLLPQQASESGVVISYNLSVIYSQSLVKYEEDDEVKRGRNLLADTLTWIPSHASLRRDIERYLDKVAP